jgi:outer membrane protein OmpA-like peptidoglycan-associated protein
VVIAPASGEFAATPGQINCNDAAKLAWSSQETVDSSISDPSGTTKLPALSGEQSVQPKQTTTYAFRASGPGGLVTKNTTINVNPTVQASLAVTPASVTYLQVGPTVLVQQNANVEWTTSNADAAAIKEIGTATASGKQALPATPKQTSGNIDETQTFTLVATNVCGGSAQKTATLEIKGIIEPPFLSVFFPTGYPTQRSPNVGLVKSQQEQLTRVAELFKVYAQFNPDAKLLVTGNADKRDTAQYNRALSQRRVDKVKTFLIACGVPEDKIQEEALGDQKQLDLASVRQLDAENPNASAVKPMSPQTAWLAYNRRVDIAVLPIQMESKPLFPYGAADSAVIGDRNSPSQRAVTEAEGAVSPAVQLSGNEVRAGK